MKHVFQLKARFAYIVFATLMLTCLSQVAFSQGMGIASTPITADPSAMLEVRSTSLGMLVPRMTTTQRDLINGGSFATSLLVYNTDTNKFNYWNGSAWHELLKANTAITAGTNTKITYDANGLVTGGTTLSAGDIPNIAESQVTNLVSDLAGKQASGAYITDLTGDAAASGPGSAALTLATVNANTGAMGSSTAIPTITTNGKGLVTAVSTNAVIAPAGTLTGSTLASGVTASSLTSVGTLANLTVTNPIAGSVTGSAASFTGSLSGDVTGTQSATVVGKINGTSLSGLATGLLKNTTGTGVPTIGVAGTDYVAPNGAITGATNTKITYDSKGLVTAGTTLIAGDIPNIAESQVTNLTTDLANKVTGNVAITGATNTKITYDAKGLVTAGSAATTADIAASTNKNYVTDAQLTVIGNTSNTNSGDVSLSAIGAAPNANGASLSGQALTLQPASASFGGVVTTGSQTFAGTKTFTAPVLGAASATSINGVSLTANATGFSVAGGTTSKTLTVNNSLTLAGTDATTMTFPSTTATLARTDAANTFTGHQTIEGVTSTGATGTGNLVFSASPTFTGTPSLPTGTTAVLQTNGTSNTTIATTSFVDAATSGSAAATIATSQTTVTTTFTDLATSGPAVTVTVPTSGTVLVILTAKISPPASGAGFMSFTSTTGTGNITANDTQALVRDAGTSSSTGYTQASATYYISGLSAGSHTFTAKYRALTATATAFENRNIIVIPMN